MSSPVALYQSWVRKNASWFIPALDTLKSMTIFLPGRFSELRSEAVYTALNLVSVYHDSIAGRNRSFVCDLKVGKDTTETRVLKNVVTFFYYTEVALEMAAEKLFAAEGRHPHPKGKWLVITLIELIKVYCRLRLLAHNGGRMLLSPSVDEASQAADAKISERLLEDQKLSTDKPFSDLRTLYAQHGRGATPHGHFTAPPVPFREGPGYRPAPTEVLAEVLHIVRPVVYVITRLCQKDPNSRNTWVPFLASLCVDICSRLLLPKWEVLTQAQRLEVVKRMGAWWFYLARDPVFASYVSPSVAKVASILKHVPIIGVFFGGISDLATTLQHHHFYTSASS